MTASHDCRVSCRCDRERSNCINRTSAPVCPRYAVDTRCPDASVEHLRALPAEEREHDVLDEGAGRVPPLEHADLNVLGR